MEDKKIYYTLMSALMDDFRGFIINKKRVVVKDDQLHILVAMDWLQENTDWKRISGIGQNPFMDLLERTGGIYVTKIEIPNTGLYQRSVGYLKEKLEYKIPYKGKEFTAYKVIRQMALDMGYDVEEYSYEGKEIKVEVYKGKLENNYRHNFNYKTVSKLQEGDIPKFDSYGKLVGFLHNGKFKSAYSYKRYNDLNNTIVNSISENGEEK